MATMNIPSAQKKEKARIVFGAAIEDEPETSLTYSPSPQKQQVQTTTTSHSQTNISSSSSSQDLSSFVCSSVDDSSENVVEKRRNRPKSAGPFDKIIAEETTNNEKENHQQQQEDIREQARMVRLQERSPLRRELVKKTQDAIQKAADSVNESLNLGSMMESAATKPAATAKPRKPNASSKSINPTLNAARQAKKETHRYVSTQTAKVRQEWDEDLALAESLNHQAEAQRRENLQLQRTLSSQYSKEKARRELKQRQQKLQEIEKESHFKSSVYREHLQKQREEEERRRRMSIEARSKLRKNHRAGEERLHLMKIEEESAIFEERHAASVAIRTTHQEHAQQRRKSFAFRKGDALRIRRLHEQLESERLQREHESYELKWAGEKDAEATKRQMEQQRRESLQLRGIMARQQRQVEMELAEKQHLEESESFELKRAAAKDVDEYKKLTEKQRRDSLAFRNQEGREIRMKESERREMELASEKASLELKWAGEKDAEEYQRMLEKQRRESLAQRNARAAKVRKEAEERYQQELASEHESYQLKWLGEKDAEDYEKRMAELRRDSLAGRNREGRRQREIMSQREQDELHAEHQSYELKWAGEKDAAEYRKAQEQERRNSLADRGKAALAHRKVMEELKMIADEKEKESFVLKWAAEEDAKAYLARVEEERRKSLQLRGQEVLHHRKVEEELRSKELQQIHDDEELRSGAQKDVEAYKKKCAERDRTSLQYRRKESQIQRLEAEKRRLEQQEQDDMNAELERQAHQDVEEYLRECRARRRMSLAVRAKERRRHAQWRKRVDADEREARSREIRARLIDQRSVELARQQERARRAMDAIRGAGYSFDPSFGAI